MKKEKLLLDVLACATEVKTKDDFVALIEGPVNRVLPHEIMTCGVASTRADGNFVRKYLSRGYPMEYYYALRDREGKINSPLMKIWQETLQTVVYQSGRDDDHFPADWIALADKHDMRNFVANGARDLNGQCGSYFIFCRLPSHVGQAEMDILNLITANLHQALSRISEELPSIPDFPTSVRALSARQQEILSWTSIGKSNWEIAKIMNISHANVKYHLDQVYQKLGVSSRADAVAYAKELGILPTGHTLPD